MSRVRRHPVFSSALAAMGVFAAAAGWGIFELWSTAAEAEAKAGQRRVELTTLEETTPPPTRESAAAIESAAAAMESAVAERERVLNGGAAAERLRAARVPAARTDAYFDLATYVEQTRALARTHKVAIAPEAARFGFAQFAREAPEEPLIPAVFRQRQVTQYLLETLFAARPGMLLAVKRERPRPVPAAGENADPAATENNAAETETPAAADGPDEFSPPVRGSHAVPGQVATMNFQLAFTGETAVLRDFLNRLAAFELPVVVREVQVEPAGAGEGVAVAEEKPETESTENAPASVVLTLDNDAAGRSVAPASRNSAAARTRAVSTAAPIVPRALSKFTVTLEYIELLTPVAPNAGPAEPAEAPASS